MNYEYMIPILVNAVKELDTENKSILVSIKELNENVDALKEEVRILKGE